MDPINSIDNYNNDDDEESNNNIQKKHIRTSKQFEMEKRQALSRLDLSKKGSIDESIESLVNKLNNSTNYYTTSSCSGRIIIVTKSNNDNENKKGLKWQFVSHSLINNVDEFIENIIEHSKNIENCDDDNNNIISTLKFESFILHLRCRTLNAAKNLLHCCIDSGQRNSGLMISNNGHLTVAVRNTLNLEIPIIIDGKLMITIDYIQNLVNIINNKMLINNNMIERFQKNCELKFIFD